MRTWVPRAFNLSELIYRLSERRNPVYQSQLDRLWFQEVHLPKFRTLRRPSQGSTGELGQSRPQLAVAIRTPAENCKTLQRCPRLLLVSVWQARERLASA